MDKKLIFFLALLFSINVFSQNIPQVPELVTLDKIRLKINEDARNEIQIEVDALPRWRGFALPDWSGGCGLPQRHGEGG